MKQLHSLFDLQRIRNQNAPFENLSRAQGLKLQEKTKTRNYVKRMEMDDQFLAYG